MCRIKINFWRRRRGGSVICLLRIQLSTKVFEVSEYDGCMYKRAFWQISSCRIVIFLQLHPTWIRRTSWQSSHVSSHLFIHAIQGLYFGSSVNIIRQTIAISRTYGGFWHRQCNLHFSRKRNPTDNSKRRNHKTTMMTSQDITICFLKETYTM